MGWLTSDLQGPYMFPYGSPHKIISLKCNVVYGITCHDLDHCVASIMPKQLFSFGEGVSKGHEITIKKMIYEHN
jgi:hypothetical protein